MRSEGFVTDLIKHLYFHPFKENSAPRHI